MHSETGEYLFTLFDPLFFSNTSSRQPSDEYVPVVRQIVGDHWRFQVKGFWTDCRPLEHRSLDQGWKIHISSPSDMGAATLAGIVPVLARRNVAFKFCSDSTMLRLSLTKNWSRAAGGKFMTIYPSAEAFAEVIEECYVATRGWSGPYILSDRPYRDSQVVFYRYGEHAGYPTTSPSGYRVPRIKAPGGRFVADDRLPYYSLPHWVADPFNTEPAPTAPGDGGVILNDRYRVTAAIKYSNVGGVYRATDLNTNAAVVIREARPLHNMHRRGGWNSQAILAKEARILEKLGNTGYVPRLLEFFEQGQHAFLVQEWIDSDSLWVEAMDALFRGNVRIDAYFREIENIFRELATGLETVHARGVVLRDLTKTNVMFTHDGRVKFIDMEFAYEIGGTEPPVPGFTAGYAPAEQLRVETPTFAEDYHALGVLLLDCLNFTGNGYHLNRAGLLRNLRLWLRDFDFPAGVADIVEALTAVKPEERWPPSRAVKAFDELRRPVNRGFVRNVADRLPVRLEPSLELRNNIASVLAGVITFTHAHETPDHTDRLWPCAPAAFQTNAAQLEFGAAGTGSFLLAVGESVSDTALDWIERHLASKQRPPGLMSGDAGIALFFHAAGREEFARKLMETSNNPELIHRESDLYFGAAGRGLANLHFWRLTHDDRFLDDAVTIGDRLLADSVETPQGLSWWSNGMIPLGFGHGQSGIGLFLLYLWGASGHDRFKTAASRAIDFDFSHHVEVETRLLWFPVVNADPGAPKSPHTRHGSAGVGSAALRCYVATGNTKYRAMAERCAATTSVRATNKIWYDYGMAGMGEFLLDMHQLLGDPLYLHNAYYVAEGILQHRIERDDGVAFAGHNLVRISCDFGHGSAGIGIFFNRLLNPQTPRFLFLDELLSHSIQGSATRGSAAELQARDHVAPQEATI